MLLTFSDFLGSIFFLPIFIYLTFAIFDGIGLIFRDSFFVSRNRKHL